MAEYVSNLDAGITMQGRGEWLPHLYNTYIDFKLVGPKVIKVCSMLAEK
jgi:hypothetical protein